MPMGFKGHVRTPNKDHLQTLSFIRHGLHLRALHGFQTPAAFDSRKLSIVGPPKSQKSCGSCWLFSGVGVAEIALYKAGVLKPDGSQTLSEQYFLSCGKSGGCGGDDNTTALSWMKSHGFPLDKDYGVPYDAQAGRCAFKQEMPLVKIDDTGFADSSGNTGQNVTPVQDIKNAIVAYGSVGCAVAAGGSQFWNDGLGTDTGNSSSIDHDVILVGWDDAHDGGAWIMRNSWGPKWGSGCGIDGSGCAWMKYGADQIGTEAVWAKSNATPPPIDWYA